jgi:hypothetical protein
MLSNTTEAMLTGKVKTKTPNLKKYLSGVKMAVEYKRLIIKANALVKRGAVGEKAIFKSKEKQIVKTDDIKLEMHSIMYMVNKSDSHGAIVKDAKVIEDACTDFMANGEKRIKLTHDGDFVDAKVMQLYIVPADHPIWKEEKYIGALATVTKFGNEELYNQCKSEGWETSLEGDVIEEEISEDSIVKKVFEMVKKMFGKEITIMKEDEKKPEKEAEKAELTPEMKDAVIAVVNEAMAGLTAKYEELNTKINALSGETSAVSETAKSFDEKIREIRKDFALDKTPAPVIDTTLVKKSLLS